MSKNSIQRFVEKVDFSGECWEWRGKLCPYGYGVFFLEKKKVKAHRVSYSWFVGEIGDLSVCHTCDNRKCVRPSHLWIGTNRENDEDRIRKGRPVGRKQLLTPAQKEEIRSIPRREASIPDLAKKYGVSRRTIERVRHGS